MNKEYEPMTYSEARCWADMAKHQPRPDVERMQRYLLQRATMAGTSSQEVLDIIYSMTERFVDEDNKMRREVIEAELRRRGVILQEDIYAEDEQIVKAIKMTLPHFKSDWDWGGIFRILVDFCNKCGFTNNKSDFVRRFARMGVYPKDNTINPPHEIPATIVGTEWHDHRFSYEAVKKGCPSTSDWPATYYEWMKSDIRTQDFIDRRNIATKFLNNLRIAVAEG